MLDYVVLGIFSKAALVVNDPKRNPRIICFYGWYNVAGWRKQMFPGYIETTLIHIHPRNLQQDSSWRDPWTEPEYLISPTQLTERGPLGFGPIQLLMDSLIKRSIYFIYLLNGFPMKGGMSLSPIQGVNHPPWFLYQPMEEAERNSSPLARQVKTPWPRRDPIRGIDGKTIFCAGGICEFWRLNSTPHLRIYNLPMWDVMITMVGSNGGWWFISTDGYLVSHCLKRRSHLQLGG